MSISSKTSNKNLTASNKFWRVIPWLRWLIIPYYFIVVLVGFFTVVIAGYGLAHGSASSNAALFALVAGAMLVATILPLAFLLKSQAIWARLLQLVGLLAFGVVLFYFAKLIFYLLIEPAIWTKQFNAVIKPIHIESLTEKPVLLDGETIGLTVMAHVVLPKPIALGRYGAVVLDSLNQLTLSAPKLAGNNRTAPFADGLMTIVTLNGKPIDDLVGMKEYRETAYGVTPNGKTQLPAGTYLVSQTFWLNGLRKSDLNDYTNPNPTPCLAGLNENAEYAKANAAHLIETNNTPLAVSFSGRLSLRDRNGYRYFSRSAPLKYRYNHAEWTKTLAELPLQSCKSIDEQKQARDAAKAAIQKAKDEKAAYDDGHLFYKENPLFTEACAGNIDAITKRMQPENQIDGVWVPRFPLSDIMRNCSIKKPQIAIFKQLAPSLYTRSKLGLANGENEYCDVLNELHSYRNVQFLSALADLKLPLDCGEKELWRSGIGPLAMGTQHSGYSDERQKLIVAAASRNDSLAWLKLLTDNHINICNPEMLGANVTGDANVKVEGKTLLDYLVRHEKPEVIAAVLDAGCDPQRQIKLNNSTDILNYDDTLPASVWWTFRRHRAEGDTKTLAIQASNAALIAKLDRALTPNVANLMGSSEYASILTANRRIIDDSDTYLFAVLVNAGLKLDYVNTNGSGLFYPAYGNDWDAVEAKRYFEMLDKLSDAQLKQLINPISSTGKPSEPMHGLKKPEYDTEAKPFRDYVCRRGVMACD